VSRGDFPSYVQWIVASPASWTPETAQRIVTIEDVARAAGVGRQTVSNVLNGSGRVGAATRARVLEAVTRLGYHPHHGARSLRSRRTMQLGYLMPPLQLQPQNLIMMQFLQALVTEASRRQYRVVVVTADGDPRDAMRRLISSRSVDAFVLSELKDDDPRVAMLHESGIPFACFGRTGPGLPQNWVDIDNAEAEAHVVRHLLDLGLTRLSYIGYATEYYWDKEREEGFRAGLASRGVPGDGAGMLRIDDDPSARGKILSFIASAKPDAVIAGSDKIAIIVYGVAADLNQRVGRDLAVAGFDGSIGADLVHPALTSVVIPVEDIARRVVARALQQTEPGQDTGPGEILPFWLRQGDSTPPHRRS
jgi:DNA-binding LacI/PurR family transcriptional regulator